ncbi:hypothetical protein GLOTRDRAFT_124019 [Gloeophyllum trabeum ATCC 11539]|uniref:D-aminoacid aminotransferase-like PLP-dependent enzyme n=1 Tax=Gloeophyllum trabeum (strain ATCC 11539 / FP-39264 / Madison 617) TaxID=670483 RepID=S7QLK2_GLOTA|nr:uncharacterized protein GLOTRDRAFT_124019 [Gloeophyllum trabeum ATCC 11539]EPQ60263.1 hypothetical protein GLOTRDRAFT_124019 [Gloeophyllum trabeum ATCC 11539]
MQTEFNLVTSTRYDPVNLVEGDRYWLLSYHVDRLRRAAGEHGWTNVKALTVDEVRLECERAVSEFIDADESTAFKIRILLTPTGILTATANATRPLLPLSHPSSGEIFDISLFDAGDATGSTAASNHPLAGQPYVSLYLDTEPTSPSIFTSTKTTNRKHYDDARKRAGIRPMTTASASSSAANHPEAHTLQSSDCDVLLYTPDLLISETTIRNVAFPRSSPSGAAIWLTPSPSTGCLPGVMRRYLLDQGRIQEAKHGELRKEDVTPGQLLLVFNGVEGVRIGRVAEIALNDGHT